jgi:hypothetical protein
MDEFEKIMNEKPNKLIDIINASLLLNDDKKMKFRSLANIYNEKFKENLSKTSLDLADTHPAVGPDTWLEFINFPDIRLYLDSFRNEELLKNIDFQLKEGSNVTGNAKLKMMLKRDMQLDNSNIIIVRLPEKEDRTYAEQIV